MKPEEKREMNEYCGLKAITEQIYRFPFPMEDAITQQCIYKLKPMKNKATMAMEARSEEDWREPAAPVGLFGVPIGVDDVGLVPGSCCSDGLVPGSCCWSGVETGVVSVSGLGMGS